MVVVAVKGETGPSDGVSVGRENEREATDRWT